MNKVKVLRHSRKLHDINRRPSTLGDAIKRIVPPATVRNIRRGHVAEGMRGTNHMGWESWEAEVAEAQRTVERQSLIKNNRFYSALKRSHQLLLENRKREAELQEMNEEMEATNEELQATNEEIQATTEELRLAGAYSRSLIEASLDTLVTIDSDGKISDVNSETERVTGLSRKELIGTDFCDYFTDPDHAKAGYEKAFQTGAVRDYPLELRHGDGHITPVLYNASVYRDKAGKIQGVFAAARDVTKAEKRLQSLLDNLKGSQAQLIQAGKMSAVGTMTAGLAHELNNPLMGILNFVQFCIIHTDKDDKRYAVLKDAEREALRSSEIVANLLTFSHMEQEGDEDYHEENPALILDRVVKLLSYRLKRENVLFTHHIEEGTPQIWINVNNIQQVFLNLMNNALDSLEKRDKKEIHVYVRPKGDAIQFTFSDTGCGIPPENLDTIFDPFFTTKPTGMGTGLGLSISHSIIKAHGGSITCNSKPGKGTTFRVLLPIEKRSKREVQDPGFKVRKPK